MGVYDITDKTDAERAAIAGHDLGVTATPAHRADYCRNDDPASDHAADTPT
jgi:hypothetical protein